MRARRATPGELEATLKANRKWSNTYFVFSADNGLHIGEYRLHPGKQTAFDTDIEVPLIVTGPGITPGTTNDQLVSYIDLAPTFERLAHTRINQATVDGDSIVPLLHGQTPPWRSFIGVEHTAAPTASGHRDDDLAFRASLVEIGQSLFDGFEREGAVDDRADDP